MLNLTYKNKPENTYPNILVDYQICIIMSITLASCKRHSKIKTNKNVFTIHFRANKT